MNPHKIIKSANINTESSYANSVLQVLFNLNCVKNWINYLKNSGEINKAFYSKALTRDIYLLYCNIVSGDNLDSSQIIMDLESSVRNNMNKNIAKDPYHFLFYLFDILHYENNFPSQSKIDYNQKLRDSMSNDINVFNIFTDYMNKMQNSFISKNFFNITKYSKLCPVCNSLYSYGFKKIIRFNLDELIFLRNKFFPLKAKNIISLNDCFYCSNKMKPSNCMMCSQNGAYQFQQIYSTSNVLIIAFNRFNHQNNFKNDVKFYIKFDISDYIINKDSEKKNYKLKGIISCYSNGRYCSYISINGQFYQFINCPGMQEVKLIKDTNELMTYEPHLLIYELENKNINTSSMIETKMVLNMKNMNNLEQTIKMNINIVNNTPGGFINDGLNISNNSENKNIFFLKYLLIPLNWNGTPQNTQPLNIQSNYDYSVQEAINNFYQVIKKPKQAIINFFFNNNSLDINSKLPLRDININQNSVIYALKSPNYDSL